MITRKQLSKATLLRLLREAGIGFPPQADVHQLRQIYDSELLPHPIPDEMISDEKGATGSQPALREIPIIQRNESIIQEDQEIPDEPIQIPNAQPENLNEQQLETEMRILRLKREYLRLRAEEGALETT